MAAAAVKLCANAVALSAATALPLPPPRHQAVAAKLPPLPRHRVAAAAVKLCAATALPPPSCRRQAAAAKLSPPSRCKLPPRHRQAAAFSWGGGADLMAWNIFGRVENYKKLSTRHPKKILSRAGTTSQKCIVGRLIYEYVDRLR